MRRRVRTPLLLFVAAVLLGAAVYAQLRREQAFAVDPLTRLDIAAVRTLAVTCQGCTPRRFEKADGRWQMREPLQKPADATAVEHLLAIATAPVRFRHEPGTLDAKKLGLDPPLATLQLDGTVLKFGTTDAINGDRYVETGGVIALVPDRFSARLFAAPQNELAERPAASEE